MSDKIETRLIGFDARKAWIDWQRWWLPQRRSAYLLCDDIHSVLSVDTGSWPSVFDCNHYMGVEISPFEQEVLAGPESPDDWIGRNDPLWADLEQLRSFLAQESVRIRRPYDIIAVTCSIKAGEHDWKAQYPRQDDVNPPAVEPRWSFLGYDVAQSFISALSNCGYLSSKENSAARLCWGNKLNHSHLFDEIEEALAFRTASNERVPEHSPFFVYGLYLVEEVAEA